MLTVKHLRQDGSEAIYCCETVRYVPDDGSPSAFGNGGLYLDPEEAAPSSQVMGSVDGPALPPYGFMARLAIPISRAESSSDLCRPEAFVMNANGATVARYAL